MIRQGRGRFAWLLGVCVIVGGSFAPRAGAADKDKARALFEEGKALLAKQRFDDAEAKFLACTQADPTFADCYLMRGASQARQGHVDQGAESYREFLRVAPNHPRAPQVRKILEDVQAASAGSKPKVPVPEAQPLEQTPNTSGGPIGKAQLAYEQGKQLLAHQRYRDAETRFRACTKEDPTFADCFMMLGATQARMDHLAEGAESYRQFLRIAPNHPKAPQVRKIVEDYDRAHGQR
jgi:TolA-binding protein